MINVNLLSTSNIQINRKELLNNRAKLDTGPLCNYDCEFCYYSDRLSERTSYETVIRRIDELLEYGIDEVDLSGGESSVDPNWFKILDYCNSRFSHISCLTHGGKFSSLEFLRKSRKAGLKEILFSLHGSTESLHDSITRRKGSFKKIIKAINNAHELNMIVRINCTVYDKNYSTLSPDLFNSLNPLEVNFITLNYWDKAEGAVGDYKALTEAIKKCIDKLNAKYINVRYTPYCYMEGYENHVCNQYQHIYDVYDWNKGIYNKTKGSNIERSYNAAKVDRLKYYKKPKECLECSHFYICDGIENELDVSVYPIKGDSKIRDVVHYRKGFYEDRY
jgi:MoaA/NifB/PqqE/SkfB family radical SAM enzyme